MPLRSRRARTLTAAAAVLAPARIRRFLHTRLLGYDIDRTARIGRSLIDVDAFRAGPDAVVCSLSILRGCERVELEREAHVGSLIWVNAIRKDSPQFLRGRDRETALVLRRAAALTSMHFLDCCDRIELGEYAILGGLWSQVLTHSFDYRSGELMVAPVEIGDYSIVGTKAVVMPGVRLSKKVVVAGGSVLPGGEYDELTLYAGVPATRKSALDPDAGMFRREDGFIH